MTDATESPFPGADQTGSLGGPQCSQLRLLLAALNHELRNSLQAIVCSAELLLAEPSMPASATRHAQAMYGESQLLRRLVDDLLDLSRIEAGQFAVVEEPFFPADVVESVMNAWQATIEGKGLGHHLEVAPGVPLVAWGDALRLQQILTNLVSNAAKYTEKGGIRLEVRCVGASEKGTTVRFGVSDTGPGIPDAAIESIFEPFRQARIGDRVKGTGLGLSIARKLVELMGGRLMLETGPAGTHFWFDLCLPHARRSGDRVAAELGQTETGGRVLVVDDSEINRVVLGGQLRRLGYVPVGVPSGAEALAALEIGDFAAVLMDWHMPELDGLETTRRIRDLPGLTSLIPVLAVTASTLTGDREQCLEAGMNDFIAKPVLLNELATKLGQWTVPPDRPGPPATAAPPTPPKDHPSSPIEPVSIRPAPVQSVSTGAADRSAEPAARTDPGLMMSTICPASILDRLHAELGDRDGARGVMSVFVAQVPVWRRDLGGGDPVRIRLTAHTVKAAAGMLGIDVIVDAAADVEGSVTADSGTADQLLARLQNELADAERVLGRFHLAPENAD